MPKKNKDHDVIHICGESAVAIVYAGRSCFGSGELTMLIERHVLFQTGNLSLGQPIYLAAGAYHLRRYQAFVGDGTQENPIQPLENLLREETS